MTKNTQIVRHATTVHPLLVSGIVVLAAALGKVNHLNVVLGARCTLTQQTALVLHDQRHFPDGEDDDWDENQHRDGSEVVGDVTAFIALALAQRATLDR